MKKTTMLCLAVGAGLVCQGCKSISTSFSFDQRILIEVPYSGEPREAIYDYAKICSMENGRRNRKENEKASRKPTLGFSLAPRDFYDGQRSGAQLLMPWRSQPEFIDRADLRQSPRFFSTRGAALKNLFFNGFLLEQYEHAHTPKKGPEESRLDVKAEKLALRLDSSK